MELLRSIVRDSRVNHWQDGLIWFVWSALGGFLPIWGTVLLMSLASQKWNTSLFTDNGEFTLYAASYLGGGLFLVIRDFKQKSFPSRGILVPVLVALLLFSAITFSCVNLLKVLSGNVQPAILELLNRDVLIHIRHFTLLLRLKLIMWENLLERG
jgi:hypothetical protein